MLRRSPKVVEVVRFIPVPAYGRNADQWESKTYLHEVMHLGSTPAYISEMTQLLADIRDVADKEETPEGLKAINKCIELVKHRLTLADYAGAKYQDLVSREEAERQQTEGAI
jgi:hypothetical protein